MADIIEEQYDPQEQTVTPTMTEVLRQAMDAMSGEMSVCTPAEVIKYDHKSQKVDVRPYGKKKYRDGSVEDAPVIYNVPLAIPRAGDAFVSLPVEKGHSVLLVFADRSIEKWLASGKSGTPDDTRKHHISDAIAIPGGYSFNNAAPVNNAKDLIIKNKNLEIRIKKNGRMQILNSQYDMIKILKEWMDASISGAWHKKLNIRRKFSTFINK